MCEQSQLHAPAFNQSRYHAVVSESLAPGSPVLQVFASDADAGANGAVTYEINRRQSEGDGPFSIDAHTGFLRLERPLDFEQRRVHELVVQARDGGAHPELGSAICGEVHTGETQSHTRWAEGWIWYHQTLRFIREMNNS